jgi:putative membrane protein
VSPQDTAQRSESAETTWHRLSPRMLLVHPVVEVGKALPVLVGIFLAGSVHGNQLPGLIATGAVVALSLTRWFTTQLRVTPDSVELRHGLVRRKTRAASRDRIRTVDVTSHLLHRALGLTRVVIGTGTNDRKGGGRLSLDGLRRPTALALRDELLHRRDTTTAMSLAKTDGQLELARLDPRWIRYAPFSLSGVITGLVLWGFYWRVQGESGVDLLHVGPLRTVSDFIERQPATTIALLVAAGVILFVSLTSTIGYVLAFWNFRLVRNQGGTIQVSRGLLTTRTTSIERRRLVGVEISEPLPLRLVSAARTSAVATGLRVGRGAERGGEVLLPPAPKDAAESAGALVLDGSPALTTALRAHPFAALQRRVNRAVFGGTTLLSASVAAWQWGAPPWVIGFGVAALCSSVVLGVDGYRNLGNALSDGYLVTRWGSLVRRRVAIAEDSVVGWGLESTYFQRRLGLVSLTAASAAGRQGYRVRDVTPDEALGVVGEVTPELLAQFRRADPAGARLDGTVSAVDPECRIQRDRRGHQ